MPQGIRILPMDIFLSRHMRNPTMEKYDAVAEISEHSAENQHIGDGYKGGRGRSRS